MQSVNQVRQLYVATAVQNSALSAKGDVVVKTVKSPIGDTAIIFQHLGEGGMTASDLINKSQISSIKVTKASDLAKSLKLAVLELNSSVNSGAPVAGQDYIVDVQVSNYITLADESVLVKFGAVHATTGMSASDFYVALAKSLARNLSRDINKFFKIYLTEEASSKGTVNSTWQEVTVTSSHTATSAFTGIIISELPQTDDFVVGETPVKTVNFKVIPHTVIATGDEIQPFVVATDGTVALADNGSTIGDGYDLADLEWFCMGERGDQIRGMGYPRNIRTKYMVDPSKEYHVLDICFFYQGHGVSVQKSEKQVTILVPKGASGHVYDTINTLIGKINSALSLSISTLS